MLDVVDPPGAEIVEDDYLMAVGRQAFGQVGSDESCSACDQIPQFTSPFQRSSVIGAARLGGAGVAQEEVPPARQAKSNISAIPNSRKCLFAPCRAQGLRYMPDGAPQSHRHRQRWRYEPYAG